MNSSLQDQVRAALARPHRLGMIGGDLEEQLAHCAGFSRFVAELRGTGPTGGPELAVDLGTGGGVPGIYLAAVHAELRWRLVEMRTSRATELERMVLRLGMDDRVMVDRRPAQEVGHDDGLRESAAIVTARAFGPPALVAECAAGLLRSGGVLLVSEPPGDGGLADRWPTSALAALGFGPPSPGRDEHGAFVWMCREGEVPTDVPRLPPRGDRGWYGN